METDELIWVGIDSNFCAVDDDTGKEVLKCSHYTGTGTFGNRTCSVRKEGHMNPNEFPCRNNPRILVSKAEYATWKLTR